MLDLINQARRAAGLVDVVSGDNAAAQIHAEDLHSNCFLSHWGSDGLKPSMRYTLAGGEQNSWENVSGSNYCPSNPSRYRREPIDVQVNEAMEGLMNSPGHRRNILFPHHRKVNLGFSYQAPNLWIVQLFENDHITFDQPPEFTGNELRFTATVRNGVNIEGNNAAGVLINYDPLPHELTRGQLHQTSCGINGRSLASLRPPLSGGWYYDEDDYTFVSSHSCTDPYDVPADVKPHSSYFDLRQLPPLTSESYTVKWITAKTWSITGNTLAVSADLGEELREYGAGVYTVVIFGRIDRESVPISQYSIFMPPR